MIICLANIKIKINNRFDFIKELCRDYLCEGEPDFTVEVTDGVNSRARTFGRRIFRRIHRKRMHIQENRATLTRI